MKIWGSRVYVTYPPEQRSKSLLALRGWIGYLVGCENDSVYLVWDPKKKTVKRIDQLRVDEGEGLDDHHD